MRQDIDEDCNQEMMDMLTEADIMSRMVQRHSKAIFSLSIKPEEWDVYHDYRMLWTSGGLQQ